MIIEDKKMLIERNISFIYEISMKKIRPKYNHVQINIKYLLITGFYDTLESERISSLSKINQSKECKIIMLTLNKKT